MVPSTPSNDPNDGDQPLDVDTEFSRIVEGLDLDFDQPLDDTESAPDSPAGLAERFRNRGWADAPVPEPDPEDWDAPGAFGTASPQHETEHYVPPPPPPLPQVEPPRMLAWLGVFGMPVGLIGSAMLRISLPGWLTLVMILAFLVGISYLVSTMRRDDDPYSGDDGAVI